MEPWETAISTQVLRTGLDIGAGGGHRERGFQKPGFIMGFVLRWLFAFVLVAATYNPTSWNYVSWAASNWKAGNFSNQLPLTLLFGLVLIVGYVIYINATLRSIGLFGMLLSLAVVGTLLWFLWDRGWLSLENASINTWLGLIVISAILGIGMTWSIVSRRLSGQIDVDDTDS